MFSQPAKSFCRALGSERDANFDHISGGMPIWKRCLDYLVVLLASPGLVVIGCALAAIIKLGSKGPVLFRQQRVGYKGRLFTCFKFRTMHSRAETSSHRNHTRELMKADVPMIKLDTRNDPRLIPFGAAIRATGLDELPQLINVLLGDMSIVGPRPCIPYEFEAYETWQRRRFDAFPGLTGLWQVSGKNETTFNQMIQMDIEYSERLSLWLDLKIILLTVPAIMKQCSDVSARKPGSSTAARSTRLVEPVQTHPI
jgi:lipopolysaccharide/colanic/teichoic acid biosynthesis glycosyltransferase